MFVPLQSCICVYCCVQHFRVYLLSISIITNSSQEWWWNIRSKNSLRRHSFTKPSVAVLLKFLPVCELLIIGYTFCLIFISAEPCPYVELCSLSFIITDFAHVNRKFYLNYCSRSPLNDQVFEVDSFSLETLFFQQERSLELLLICSPDVSTSHSSRHLVFLDLVYSSNRVKSIAWQLWSYCFQWCFSGSLVLCSAREGFDPAKTAAICGDFLGTIGSYLF